MPRRSRQDEYIPIKIEGWNGKFVRSNDTNTTKDNKSETNVKETINNISEQSNKTDVTGNKFHGYCTENELLPVEWSGKFIYDPNNIITRPERNQSDDRKFFAYSNETIVLPTEWNGKFQIDPNDVRIKPERNYSDVRDFAEAKNFTITKK